MVSTRDKRSTVFLLIILLIVIVVSVMIGFSLKKDPIEEIMKRDSVIKILWVLKDDDGSALFTDILLYNPKHNSRGVVFEIPGNTGAIYKESLGRTDRIDAVYFERGIEVYKKEIERLTAREGTIPFTIEISLKDLSTLTDFLGGLDIFVPYPIDSVSENGERYLLPSGAVNLDGDKLRTFIDYKADFESNSEVEGRRQEIFMALLAALTENKKLVLNKKAFDYCKKFFKTNIEDDDFYRLLDQVVRIDTEHIVKNTVGGNRRKVDDKELLFPDFDGRFLKEVMAQEVESLSNGSDSLQSKIVITILNGTEKRGFARNAKIMLSQAGYDVYDIGNAETTDYKNTLIIDRSGNEEKVRKLAEFIKCENIEKESDLSEIALESGNEDITLILGEDFDGRKVVKK